MVTRTRIELVFSAWEADVLAAWLTGHKMKVLYTQPLFLIKKGRCRHRPIFPGRFQPSIFSTCELNYRVRNGNGWILTVIDTDSSFYTGRIYLVYTSREGVPSKPNNTSLFKWLEKTLQVSLSFILAMLWTLLWSSPRPISISQLNTSRHLHLWPINHIVFVGSYQLALWDILSHGGLHA